MKIAFYGSSLLSCYWNGAATYYRGILRALAGRGYDITFYEPDVYDRQKNRDIDPPPWCQVVVYPGTTAGLRDATAHAAQADIVVKTSGVGFEDEALLEAVLDQARSDALRIWWDVDAPATLADVRSAPDHKLRARLPDIDLVLTYGGGPPCLNAYRALGARTAAAIYNALDPETHHPVPPDPRFAADLSFLGNRLPDRERRVEEFFLGAAQRLPDCGFLLGGAGWDDKPRPRNVRYIGHVGTNDHNALNCSAKAVLNINRDSMADIGYSPPTRVFEAAGAAACLITDAWVGVELFLVPGQEVLVARDGGDVAAIMSELSAAQARAIGERALARVLKDHTYCRRAEDVDRLIRTHISARRAGAAA